MPRLAAIYARVSTEEQARTSGVPSTAIQVQKCCAFAAALGIPVADVASGLRVEEEHSGHDLRWEGTKFMELVRRAQRHEFTDLICLDIDRFCRAGAGVFGMQKGWLTDAGVEVHFAQMTIPKDIPLYDGIVALLADAAKVGSRVPVERSKATREAAADRGDFMPGHAAPFGWAWIEDHTRKTRKDKPVKIGLRPHAEYGAVLLHMYEHIAACGSVWALAHALDDQRIPTARGASNWSPTAIRRIIENPTNWGERKTFMTKTTPRPEGVRRPVELKTPSYHRVAEPHEQRIPTNMVFEPIPGLTRDLAMRAVAQLAVNLQNSRRRATHTDEERAARGLLFNGGVRCAVCGLGMRIKGSHAGRGAWMYTCFHIGKPQHGQPVRAIATRTLDALVWDTAMQAIRDPNFFEQLLKKTDEVAGAAARAASLERQLADAKSRHDRLFAQLDKLGDDDGELIADYQEKVRQTRAAIKELTAQLDATRLQAAKEQERRASIAAFRDYAATQTDLEQKTPLERRQVLQAMRTRVRFSKTDEQSPHIYISFDVRYLPGAAAALSLDATETPQDWVNLDWDALAPTWTVEVLQTEGRERFQPAPVRQITLAEAHAEGFESVEEYEQHEEAAIQRQEQEQQAAMLRYRAWLTATGKRDSESAWNEWYALDDTAGQNGGASATLPDELAKAPATQPATSTRNTYPFRYVRQVPTLIAKVAVIA